MKPLNRPMFKYGGPIKEGIMQGMKDGGSLSPQFNTGLVGDERYPKTGGRENHAFFLAPLAYQGIMAGARMLAPRAIAAGAKAFGRGLATSPGAGTSVFGKGLTMGQRLKNLLPSGRFRDAGSKIPLGGRNPNNLPVPFGSTMDATGKLSLRQSLTDPRRLGMAIRENPITAFTAAGQIKNIPDIVSGGAGLAADAALGATNYLLGTDFSRNKIKPPTGDGTGIKRGDKNQNVGDVTGTTKPGETGGATVKTDAEKQQINEDRIQETKNKYYKLMGIDKMNKEATYDSLIDASKIISQEGGDLTGAIKSGSLQSQLISAISKNLDKSSALKKQIDAAVLKAEIEKDIKRSDPDAAINREYKQTQIALGKKKLEGPSAADVMSSATIDGKNIVTSNTLTSVLSGMGRDVDFTFPDDKYQKWEKSNEGKDEIDYLTENYGGLDDGLYVVNKKAFEVRDGSVFQVDLDKVTG
jgi:hypothetical protein